MVAQPFRPAGIESAAEFLCHGEGEFGSNTRMTELVTDPACGRKIDPAHAAGSSEYHGRTIYFCALSCNAKFDAKMARMTPRVERLERRDALRAGG